MKKCCQLLISLLLFTGHVFASTTLTSSFVITNRSIDSVTFSSTDASMSYTDLTGSGLFQIHDNFNDATHNILTLGGNQQIAINRTGSLLNIVLTGQKLKHKITVQAKYQNSAFRDSGSAEGVFVTGNNSGCTLVDPRYQVTNGATTTYTIQSSTDVTKECLGKSYDINHNPKSGAITVGISRDFIIDLQRLMSSNAFRNAPPDTYTGSATYNKERIDARTGTDYPFNYINNMTLIKNPYFEGVTLPSGDNVFDVRSDMSHINGNLTIPYVINGQFTPYNKITLNVISANGFSLKNGADAIPYSFYTRVGSQQTYTIARNGMSQGMLTLQNLPSNESALNSVFLADFSVDKSTAVTGDYTDTLTAIYEIAL